MGPLQMSLEALKATKYNSNFDLYDVGWTFFILTVGDHLSHFFACFFFLNQKRREWGELYLLQQT